MSVFRTLAALLLASAAAGVALAQSPAPAADASKCTKPGPHPMKLASDNVIRAWDKTVVAWQDCMKKYIADVQARADAAVKSANEVVAEANAAVNEFNATVKDLQAQADASRR